MPVPSAVALVWSVNGQERVEAFGFRLCRGQSDAVLVSVEHAVREGSTWADFGDGPQALTLESACWYGDVAVYLLPTPPSNDRPCWRLASETMESETHNGAAIVVPEVGAGGHQGRVDGTIVVEEWGVSALALSMDGSADLSGAPVLDESGEAVGMVFGRTQDGAHTLATPISLIRACEQFRRQLELNERYGPRPETRIAD